MPYKDREMKRKFQREWLQARRQAWFDENGPCRCCGSDVDLEMHHLDPEQKESHSIWSWSKERRDAETAKCIVLCKICHRSYHAALMKLQAAKRKILS